MKKSPLTNSRYSALLREFLLGNHKVISAKTFEGDTDLFSSDSMAARMKSHEAVVSACISANASTATKARVRKQAARYFARALASLHSPSGLNQMIIVLSIGWKNPLPTYLKKISARTGTHFSSKSSSHLKEEALTPVARKFLQKFPIQPPQNAK
jgi:hypothetical protein